MHNETIEVQLFRLNGEYMNGVFILFEESPRNRDMVLLQLIFEETHLSSENENLFAALLDIRRELEFMNIQVACYGAAENVYPSAMQLSMGDGRKAYKLTFGQQARTIDVVDIFEYEKDLKYVSINAQTKFHSGWLKSLP